MKEQISSLNNLRIASPCRVGWESMDGDERTRFCSLCELHVYNISEMTTTQARDLIMNTEGRICARLFRRADGTVITRDCPVGLRAMRRRVARAAGAVFAAILSACSVTFGQTSSKKNQSCGHVPQLRVKRITRPNKQETFTGVITDEMGAVIPGVNVTLIEESTRRRLAASTSVEGEFMFPPVPAGKYTVETKATGFKTFKLKHVQMNSGEAAHFELILKVDGETVTVGILVDTPMIESVNGTTIIRGDMIRKLPIPE